MSLSSKSLDSGVWVVSGQFIIKCGGFIQGIILARILMPQDFGLLAMVTVFVSFGMVLADSQLTASLIQKKDLKAEDRDTAFWTNLLFSVIITTCLFSGSQFVAKYYGEPRLEPLIQALSLLPIIEALGSCQKVEFQRKLNFKELLLKVEAPTMVVGTFVAISIAYAGLGVWALIFGRLVSSVLGSALLWKASHWRPKLRFSKESFKSLIGYSGYLTLAALINNIFTNLYPLLIGKLFSPLTLGFYQKAYQLQMFPAEQMFSVINRLSFPILSGVQDDGDKLFKGYRVALCLLGMVVIPAFCFLGFSAQYLIPAILSKKWIDSIPFFQILCIVGVLYPFSALNLSLLRATGKSKEFLCLSIVKRAFTVVSLSVTYRFGIVAMIYGQVLVSIISFWLNTYFTQKYLGLGFRRHIVILAPFLLVGFLVAICNYVFYKLMGDINPWFGLFAVSLLTIIIVIPLNRVIFYEEKDYLKTVFNSDPRFAKISWLLFS